MKTLFALIIICSTGFLAAGCSNGSCGWGNSWGYSYSNNYSSCSNGSCGSVYYAQPTYVDTSFYQAPCDMCQQSNAPAANTQMTNQPVAPAANTQMTNQPVAPAANTQMTNQPVAPAANTQSWFQPAAATDSCPGSVNKPVAPAVNQPVAPAATQPAAATTTCTQ